MITTYIYLIAYAVALLALISLGLSVIFGMMKVINLAHGEFMMLGAYACVYCSSLGLPFWASLIVATLAVGCFGLVVERLLIRHLYGRIVDTLLATWGLSLLLIGVSTAVFGPQARSMPGIPGTVAIGGTTMSVYSFVLIGVTILMMLVTWLIATRTKVGLVVRGTMQRPDIAGALGINTNLVYMGTFGFGAAAAGLAGAMLAPLTGATPLMGAAFVSKAFINVIVAGGLPLIGTSLASAMFGTVDAVISYLASSVAGEVAVLVFAVVLLRMLPQGITGRFRRGF
ncbi:branched-chain amino acid ABC transporter permease [Pseudotabrizicola sp. 4114]|uniref:branched-chain amino acid ABC transporter permease n=1 Tax=Pseudotabrizicola sp. 4114 TaxID=2817731 RepID=UPI00286060BA|nr:branched-chain amino acid transport system permease protein [Pseudorhodobacter sp. 4114]